MDKFPSKFKAHLCVPDLETYVRKECRKERARIFALITEEQKQEYELTRSEDRCLEFDFEIDGCYATKMRISSEMRNRFFDLMYQTPNGEWKDVDAGGSAAIGTYRVAL